jgi:hypothetical protein
MVDRDLAVEGYLVLGVSDAEDPLQVAGAREIRGWEKSASFKGNKFIRKALL